MAKSRKERRRQEVIRQRRKRRLYIGIPAVLVVLIFGFLIYQRFIRPIEGLREVSGLSRGHDQNADLEDEGMPPLGGVHQPTWQNCGVYRQPVETELAVHSMEHGAIWLAYHPDLAADQIAALEAKADDFTLVAPYPDLESNVVATAWGAQITVDEVPNDNLDRFIARYKGQGPENASCTGGRGTPLN